MGTSPSRAAMTVARRVEAARKVLLLEFQLTNARKRLHEAESEATRLSPRPRSSESIARRLSKAERAVADFAGKLAEATSRAPASEVERYRTTLREARAHRSARVPNEVGAQRVPSPVRVTRFTPVATAQTTCKQCHKSAQIRSGGMCSRCLKGQNSTPCPPCGPWLTLKQRPRHACRDRSSQSVRTVSGGAPELGKRR